MFTYFLEKYGVDTDTTGPQPIYGKSTSGKQVLPTAHSRSHAALLRSGARVHVAVGGPDVLHVLRVDRFAARRVRERFDLDQAVKEGLNFGKIWKSLHINTH